MKAEDNENRGEDEKPLLRLKRKLGIETLWIFILAILSKRDSYAYDIIKKIKKIYGFNPGKVLPYVVLKKLELEGYVASYDKERRKYYRITQKGRNLLQKGKQYLQSTLQKIDYPSPNLAIYTGKDKRSKEP